LIANGTHASVYANDGPGHGLYRAIDNTFTLGLPSNIGDIVSDQEGVHR
jgi:hypothetical protein